MNILPKKRWHVRTKENIARVRRDEAAALEQEKESQRRILLAEQEARTNLLRAKARSGKDLENCEQLRPNISDSHRHVNFFEDIERDGRYTGGVNKEHEVEKKEEREKYEKSIGLLNYLGQGSTESTGETPWYLKSHEARIEDEKKEKQKSTSSGKEFLDPMNDMKKYLKMSFGSDDTKKKSISNDKRNVEKNKKHRKKNCGGKNDDDVDKKKTSLEKLREERLKREKSEREREHQLLAKLRGDLPKSQAKPIAIDERQNRYNSQFNPHLARQNQPAN